MPNVKIMLTKMRCLRETDEVGSDEPYVLVFAAMIEKVGGLVNIPSAATTIYGPWNNTDEGDLVETAVHLGGKQVMASKNFWGLDGHAQQLNDPDNVIFLAGLMENDDADTGGIRAALHAQLFAAISSYANSKMSRESMVKKLKGDMRDVLKGVTVTGLPNNDDFVGITEVRFGEQSLKEVEHQTIVKAYELAGDGGRYRLRFEMKKG